MSARFFYPYAGAPASGSAPVISSFTPTVAAVGGTIFVTGNNLLNATGVTIGGVAAALPGAGTTATPNTKVTLIVPAGALSGQPITITTAQGTAVSSQTLALSAPLPAPDGAQAVPAGVGALRATAQTVNGATGYVLLASNTSGSGFTQLGGTLPTPDYAEAGLGYSHLRYYRWKALGNGSDLLDSAFSTEFSGTTTQGQVATDPPTITSVPTNASKFGQVVSLPGTNFIGATSVTINNVAVDSFSVLSATEISLTVSPAQTTGLVRVTTQAGTGVSASNFLVAPATVNEGITRVDITVDFSAVNATTKTPSQVVFSNGYGSNYAAQHLYKGGATLKIRGNTTAVLPKKPFSLTLTKGDGSDQKFPALGMYNDSDFVLLAEYQDPTYLRTYVSQEISRGLGLVTVQTRPIELYINGDYYGLYSITEKVKQSLIGLETLGTGAADQQLPNLDGGYLYEKVIDVQEDMTQGTYFKSLYYNDNFIDIRGATGNSILIEYPKFGKITQTQQAYAQQTVLDAEATLAYGWLDEDYGPQTKYDATTLLKYYIASEFCQSLDAENHSAYFYKKRGGKLMHGPLWDMDISFLTYTYYAFLPDHATANYIWQSRGWARSLFLDRYFLNDLSKLYTNTGRAVIQNCVALMEARAVLLSASGALDRNNVRWGVNTTQYVTPISTGVPTNNYQDHLQLLRDFISARLAHFDTTYVPLSLIGVPVGGYKIEMLDYQPHEHRFYGYQEWLVGIDALTVFLVCNIVSKDDTQTFFTIGLGAVTQKPTSLLWLKPYGFGLNEFTPADDTFDDLTIFDSGKLRLVSASIFNNDPTRFTMRLNGVALPHSIKPAGDTLPNADFGNFLNFGFLDPNLGQLDAQGQIVAYVYPGVMSEERQQRQLQFMRDNWPEVTE